MSKTESNQAIDEQNKEKLTVRRGWDKRFGTWKQLDSQTDPNFTLYSRILFKEQTIYLLRQYKLCNNNIEGNRYIIKNNFIENLFYGIENNYCSDRLCICSGKRSFSLTFFGVNREPVFVLRRPFRIGCCGLIPCCRQKIEIKDNSNKTIGKVIEKFSLFRASLKAISDQTELTILGPKCQTPLNYCLDDLCFDIQQKTINNQTIKLGHICKFCELTNGGHIYKIVLNVETSPQIKCLIIGATVLIDYNYFDNTFHEHKYHSLTMSSVSQTLPPFPMLSQENRQKDSKV